MTTDPRRRDPAINRALRALGLPPLLTGDYDEDPEPMNWRTAQAIVVFYGLAFGFGLLCIGALHDHLHVLH
jgi:hypothetical protein